MLLKRLALGFGFLLIVLSMVVCSIDNHPSPLASSAKVSAGDPSECLIIQWPCAHGDWSTPADSTFSIFYSDYRFLVENGRIKVDQYISPTSRRTYYVDERPHYDQALFTASDGQCGFWSAAMQDSTLGGLRIFAGNVRPVYRSLENHHQLQVIEDGQRFKIASVEPDRSLRYVDFNSVYWRDKRPPSIEQGLHYLPLNFDLLTWEQDGSVPVADDLAYLVSLFVSFSCMDVEAAQVKEAHKEFLRAFSELIAAFLPQPEPELKPQPEPIIVQQERVDSGSSPRYRHPICLDLVNNSLSGALTGGICDNDDPTPGGFCGDSFRLFTGLIYWEDTACGGAPVCYTIEIGDKTIGETKGNQCIDPAAINCGRHSPFDGTSCI